ncbi:MAG TPA: hypothetical protein VEB21_01960, partial [Terriglobales bacterium]|nr:hypothetical protein [Terriglobales bacterium]
IVGAVKATGGVVSQLIRGSATADGADPVRELPSATAEDRLYRLAVAEHQLRARAKESDGRFSLLRHGMNVAVNVAGAMIVWQGFEARTRAWRSAATGIAVGEIMIWTIPWYGRSELEQYEQRHNVRVPQGPRVSWGIAPSLNGASVQLRF